jgi:hypothetical protein
MADVAGHRHGEGLGLRLCLSGRGPERQGTSIGRASPPACLFSEGSGASVGTRMEWATFALGPCLPDFVLARAS